ncbi:MarR family winged helix-turn-helix transcriptional regulator [Brevibacillus invocatus]|uniref:MarR family winged helix-turn-helix transcriptional regulator n=1 Tax=Brevibacillus invocatus TaxID=173959 RepID=UPI001606CB9D|nr:MarR family transcriptional regulator [Brevibacillus invocatus]
MSTEQWIILNELWRKDGLSQLELATATMRDQPSTSRIINTLTKRGLVYRAQDSLDKRKNLIFLTDKGKELQEALIGVVKQTIAESVKGIAPKDLDTCMEVLRLIRANTRSNR